MVELIRKERSIIDSLVTHLSGGLNPHPSDSCRLQAISQLPAEISEISI